MITWLRILILVVRCFSFPNHSQLSLRPVIWWYFPSWLWIEIMRMWNFEFITLTVLNVESITIIALFLVYEKLSFGNCVSSLRLWIYPIISLWLLRYLLIKFTLNISLWLLRYLLIKFTLNWYYFLILSLFVFFLRLAQYDHLGVLFKLCIMRFILKVFFAFCFAVW